MDNLILLFRNRRRTLTYHIYNSINSEIYYAFRVIVAHDYTISSINRVATGYNDASLNLYTLYIYQSLNS